MYISEDRYIKKFHSYSKMVQIDLIEQIREKNIVDRKNEDFKLSIELVPSSNWFKNVRSNIKDSEWNRIRYVTYGLADYKCEICIDRGNRHPVECHEIWDYDDANKNQTLKGFIALCPLCHEVKHIGLAGVRGNFDRAFERFKNINDFSENEADNQFSISMDNWARRSKIEWNLNLDILEFYNIEPKSKENNNA